MLFPAVLLRLLAFVTFSNLAFAAAVSPLLKHQTEEIATMTTPSNGSLAVKLLRTPPATR
jgi:hypothetical protein